MIEPKQPLDPYSTLSNQFHLNLAAGAPDSHWKGRLFSKDSTVALTSDGQLIGNVTGSERIENLFRELNRGRIESGLYYLDYVSGELLGYGKSFAAVSYAIRFINSTGSYLAQGFTTLDFSAMAPDATTTIATAEVSQAITPA